MRPVLSALALSLIAAPAGADDPGSKAPKVELVTTHGADSLLARMAGTIMGSTETTFYVLAVYFGSVAIRRTRHAVPAGLIADLTGIIAAVTVCRIVFG